MHIDFRGRLLIVNFNLTPLQSIIFHGLIFAVAIHKFLTDLKPKNLPLEIYSLYNIIFQIEDEQYSLVRVSAGIIVVVRNLKFVVIYTVTMRHHACMHKLDYLTPPTNKHHHF